MRLVALIVVVSLLVLFPIAQAIKTKNLGLNHKSLHEQPIFWAAINWPIAIALALGFPVWTSYSPRLDQDGYSFFLEISKLPLGILGAGLAITAFAASIHRSIQTAKQIEHSESKKQDEIDERTLATAQECLEKAYELLTQDDEINYSPAIWKNSANLISAFQEKKKTINTKKILEQLEVQEDYWRAKFEDLLNSAIVDYFDNYEIPPAIIFLVAEFSTWREERIDAAPYQKGSVFFERTIKKLNGNRAIQYYLSSNKQSVIVQQVSMLVSTRVSMPHPDKVFEDAVNGPLSEDPIVRAEQERRGLIPNTTKK